MKFLPTIISGVVIGVSAAYFALDWPEEELIYSLTSPAKFGEINYQNITLTNTGWNPAINLKVFIEHPNIKFSNAQSKTTIKDISIEKNGIAGIERIRRDESVVISLAYEGQPLFGSEITISSDRSIAEQVEAEDKEYMPMWATSLLIFFGITFIVGLLASIAIPAYQGYIKAAQAAEKNTK